MQIFLQENYFWLKAFHVIAVMAWMAGMLYLPRLYVYHVSAKKSGELSETLKTMERRLLRLIINPAMILTFIFGGLMLYANTGTLSEPWMHGKFMAIILMTGVHGLFSRWRKAFERDENTHSETFYRWWNEAPTVLMIAIVILVIVKPF